MDLKYGKNYLSVELPFETDLFESSFPQFAIDSRKFKLELEENLRKTKSNREKYPIKVGIVVADKTRKSQYDIYLSLLTSILESFYISPEICFYIAYGTHKSHLFEENEKIYGKTYERYKFFHHSSESDDFICYGTTKAGTKVEINSKIFRNDIVITFGAITHHYFAGYGGGRKLIFPGLASKKSILANHSLFLDIENNRLNRNSRSGNLENNPISKDLKEIYELLPRHISIHSITNSEGKVIKFIIGDSYDDFLNACSFYNKYFRIASDKKYDLVVASAGGHPKDINFIQVHKSIHNAYSFVKKAGKLIIFAKCSDGIGNDDFLRIYEEKVVERKNKLNRLKYANNTGTALSLYEKVNIIDIFIITNLSKQICSKLGLKKIELSDANNCLKQLNGDIACIPNASMIFT